MIITICTYGSIIILLLRILALEKDIKELRQNIMGVNHKYDEKLRQIYYYTKDHK